MRKIQYIIRCTLVCIGVFAGFTSCDHKELCYDHDVHSLRYHSLVKAEYELEWQRTCGDGTDWKTQWPEEFEMTYDDLCPGVPEGLRALVYNGETNSIVNLPALGGTLPIPETNCSLLFYNNDTEYIVFNDLESFASARATTRTRTRASYMGNEYVESGSEKTVNPPDILFGNYIDSYACETTPEPVDLPLVMHPLVFTYHIRYEFSHGLQYVSLARGALAGMAGDVYLNSGRTSENEVTVLYDCTVGNFGVHTLVNSFGIPDYPNDGYTRSTRTYGLNLEVRLKNGKMLSFDFDVTDQVAAQPNGGVIIVKGIEIPDEEGQGGSSGFDIDVDDWGEFEDIDLIM